MVESGLDQVGFTEVAVAYLFDEVVGVVFALEGLLRIVRFHVAVMAIKII